MAIALTMEEFSLVEPMKKNRFLVQFAGGLWAGASADTTPLSLACHACTPPKLSLSVQELHRFNDRVYVPGKGEYETVDFEFYEFIGVKSTDGTYSRSAGDILWGWLQKGYNPATGEVELKRNITSTALIVQFDGRGNVLRTWTLYHAWPIDVEFDNLDSTSDEVQSVKVTLRFDWAAMNENSVSDGSEDVIPKGEDDDKLPPLDKRRRNFQ